VSTREGRHHKPIHLAVQSNGQIDYESLVRLAQTAERGLFDFVVLAEPDTFTLLAALAGVTERIGLVGTVNTAVNEPFEVARQFATLDHLSDGRAGWNVIATSDAFTGANFRRAGEFLDVARQFWDSWDADAVIADDAAGIYIDPSRVHTVHHSGAQFNVQGMATLPAGPQGHPVLLHGGDSSEDRDFGAAQADLLFTAHSTLEAGQRYYADVTARAVGHGRNPERLMVLQVARIEQFVGTPDHIAAEIDRYVQSEACDGFILVPPQTPDDLDGFVDTVVPLLQERGVFRSAYTGDTLRDHLGLTG
jgi:alkanesulfonate monooxygenase SsuD/methylene tetrahydromethanopterin reductase-like flavin-dependent oxidoreductase (luciferase family)